MLSRIKTRLRVMVVITLAVLSLAVTAFAPAASAGTLSDTLWRNWVTGQCLAMQGSNWISNPAVYQFDCHSTWGDQHWAYRYTIGPDNQSYPVIANLGVPGRCLWVNNYGEASHGSCGSNFSPVTLIELTGTSPLGYKMKDPRNNTCLAIRTGDGWTANERAIWAPCNDAWTDQIWWKF